MSQKYTGGFITKSPVAPTTSAASGIWTLDQQQQAQKAGTWPSPPVFIEDLFSTYLYTGNGSTQTITNGIDLSGNGGLVWMKQRTGANGHNLYDTARGATQKLATNETNESNTVASGLTSFSASGFSLGSFAETNLNTSSFVSWTFREQPKFFDIVTYTGNATGPGTGQAISHNLGSVPGCIIVKQLNTTRDWAVYHRSLANTEYLTLNSTAAKSTDAEYWRSTTPTSTSFSVGNSGNTNNNGGTYVAYLFAHDAGGFPVSGGGSTNGISCGSYVSDGSRISVTLGYEPQWILIKKATGASNNWTIVDSMRGLTANAANASAPLFPNLSDAETASSSTDGPAANATGFSIPYSSSAFNYPSGETYIYIAIRRGPMKTPTVGTSVFQPYNAADNTTQTVGFPTDMYFDNNKTGASYNTLTGSRLIGTTLTLSTSSTSAETTSWGPSGSFASNTTFAPTMIGAGTVWYSFRRSPSFFDEVCYTGTGTSPLAVSHNLAAIPEMMIVKDRGNADSWYTYHANASGTPQGSYLTLNSTGAVASSIYVWGNTLPTSSVFTVGATNNTSAYTYVAYLFATCAGVSKVGSYTGTGAAQTINCGFTAGSRFVLIKRTDSTGDWYVWDSARGIVAGNDPHLSLNTTAAQVTTDDSLDTDSTGFIVNQDAATNINVTSATYIFLAIA